MSAVTSFLSTISRSMDAAQAAIADNCRFDERAAPERWEVFEVQLPHNDNTAITWEDWGEANQLYIDQRINVARVTVPDTFLEINKPAWKQEMSDNQTVVRIEDLRRPLDAAGLSFEELNELIEREHSPNDHEASQALGQFFETWNQRRDARPQFSAFYDEVREEAESHDWPHELRNRLGLGHYGGSPDAPIPVALMKYPLKEVLRSQQAGSLPTACALPTVLDGGMHEFFFPVPKEHPFGATLHLIADQAEQLTAEILHCCIEYRPEHLHKIGVITTPHNLHGNDLREARNLHLLALQEATNRADFGELLVGRR